MNKGGYQIIDLKNKPMRAGEGMIFEGIYDKLEGTRKPTLVSGLHFEGKEVTDFFATFHLSGSDYVYADDYNLGITISINSNDVVTITEM